jgi:hypothetical protein
VNDLHITDGVNVALDVRDLVILEDSSNVEDSIDGLDVGKEGVSETLTLSSTLYKTGNIDDLEEALDSVLGLVVLAKPLPALIRNEDTSCKPINKKDLSLGLPFLLNVLGKENTIPLLGSMVQKGKFSAGMLNLVNKLKRVLKGILSGFSL